MEEGDEDVIDLNYKKELRCFILEPNHFWLIILKRYSWLVLDKGCYSNGISAKLTRSINAENIVK